MAQIEKSTIIKLRQSESNGVRYGDTDSLSINGAFNITLNNPVIMETGDTVRLHTAILDSSAEGSIDIAEDLDVEIDVCRYLTYYENIVMPAGPPRTSGAGAGNGAQSNYIYKRVGVDAYPLLPVPPPAIPATNTANSQFIPSNAKYWAGILSGNGWVGAAYPVTNVVFFKHHKDRLKRKFWGDCWVDFKYTDPITGKKVTTSVLVPRERESSTVQEVSVPVLINVLGNTGASFEVSSTADFMVGNGLDTGVNVYYGPEIPSPVDTKYSTPYIETLKITIPARRYLPAELCSVINDSISLMNLQGNTGVDTESAVPTLYPTENPFLGTVRQMEAQIQKTTGHELVFMRESSADFTKEVTEYLTIDTEQLEKCHNDLWCGANQVQLNYDPVLETINFAILHFPIYVPLSGGADDFVPGVAYNDLGEVTTTFSGVTLMGLRPQNFWTETLGFNQVVNNFRSQDKSFRQIPYQINTTTKVPYPNTPFGDSIYPFKMGSKAGVNITDVYLGIDLPITKDISFWGVADGATATKPKFTATSLTLPIFSTRIFNSPLNDEGYYLIEIGFAFAQKMVGAATVYNNIQSIIGKYFTSPGNFLQDQGSGSISYQHFGESQMLTDISVRILNADGSLLPDTVLGPQNSIFLELIKTLNLPPQKTTLAKS
tara:strand:- start:861 stop:2837 length:1977 start_codon:yes stop_codon:yes gene_type:complete